VPVRRGRDAQIQPTVGGAVLDYRLSTPKWKFLCWLAETKDMLLHGSGRENIVSFERRRADDASDFGGQQAVFATSDGIWAMFFAIANRPVATSLVNASFSVDEGGTSATFYYFSINNDAFDGNPWQQGTVYVLPRTGFDRQDDEEWHGVQVTSHEWASAMPVQPMASLIVTPADFPFLDKVNAHDQATVAARESTDPDGFPWRDDFESSGVDQTPAMSAHAAIRSCESCVIPPVRREALVD
jgi:hypothetical protein